MAAMLDEKVREQIINIFKSLNDPVDIVVFGSEDQNCEYCGPTRQLLEDVVSLSDKLSLEVFDIDANADFASDLGIEDTPAIAIGAQSEAGFVDYGLRYYGIPAGHEFTSLIRDILMVSARDSGLSGETREYLASLDHPIKLQVFVTPTCPYCPQAVILAHQLAFESPMIEAQMIEAIEFPELSEQFGVSGVPHTIINEGAGEVVGAVPEAVLLQKIKQVVADES